eukprot:9982336-Alexandrium_andersonii.AAC.1
MLRCSARGVQSTVVTTTPPPGSWWTGARPLSQEAAGSRIMRSSTGYCEIVRDRAGVHCQG